MFHRVKSETPQDNLKQQSSEPESSKDKTTRPEAEESDSPSETIKNQSGNPQNASSRFSKSYNTGSYPGLQNKPSEKETSMNTQDNATDNENRSENAASAESGRTLDIPSSAYGRPSQSHMMKPGSSYPGASYPGATSYGRKSGGVSENERTLTIGAGITLSGEIESCDYLLVEGTVEAALKGASVLDIAESGVFYGTVEIEDATIAGRFEGDITAHGRLTIRSSGVVTGTISYRELEVESGAIIDGKLTPVSNIPSVEGKGSAKSKGGAPASKAKSASKDQSANDGELFTSSAAAE